MGECDPAEEGRRLFAQPGVRTVVGHHFSHGESGPLQALGSWPELGRVFSKMCSLDFSLQSILG